MSSLNYKAYPNCLALVLLATTVSIGLFNEYLVEVRRVKYVDDKSLSDVEGDASVREFRINISDQILHETFLKLERSVLLLKHQSDDQHLKLLFEIVDYWRNKYEWREREAYFNKYPNYKTTIHGADVHYVHIPSSNNNTVPILMLHGWPGSFKDFYELIPMLKSDFTIVIPSLLGHGFSSAGGPQQATVFYKLMLRLGYEKFYVYGNDWGSVIATNMAIIYPKHIMGLYSPFCLSMRRVSVAKHFLESLVPNFLLSEEYKSKYTIIETMKLLWKESAFINFHLTKPESIGFYLKDSPISVAHYILDIIKTVTYLETDRNVRKNLTEMYGFENLIDVFMLHWVTESTTTAVQSLKDIVNDLSMLYQTPIKAVPAACPKFLNGIFYQSDWILRDKYEYLVNRKTFNKGNFYLLESESHFLKLIAADVNNSIKEMMFVKKF